MPGKYSGGGEKRDEDRCGYGGLISKYLSWNRRSDEYYISDHEAISIYLIFQSDI